MALIPLVIAILATYRMALLLPEDDGPFYVFMRIRTFTTNKAMNEKSRTGFWHMLDEGITCPYCMGLYAAILAALLVAWDNYYGNIFLLTFAIAGGQSALQNLRRK